MTLTLDAAIALIPIVPFMAAIVAPFVQHMLKGFSGWLLALIPAAIFAYLTTLIAPVAANGAITASLSWIPAYQLDLSFLIDGLSLTFALAISGTGALITLYSGAYLKGHPHQGRFFAFMFAFMGAMLGLVLADNLLVLFGFWELTAVTSFLLIGFDNSRQAARRAAVQALIVTNVGGLALLVAAILLQRIAGPWELSALLESGDAIRQHAAYLPALILILLAAFTKSAQFPFHFWLPNAMEAPTPVSAFLHSATMVQAGIYLLARMTPVLGGTPQWGWLLGVFGGITLIWGALAALRQTDLKLMLAQSTVASLGLMVLLLGIGSDAAIAAALIFFVAHALYKAALFLVVGIIDHETGTRDLTALSGLWRKLPLTFLAALVAGLSMAGIPATLGFLAKDEAYAGLVDGSVQSGIALTVLVLGLAILVALALTISIRPFFGRLAQTPKSAREGSLGLVLGPLVLAAGGIAGAIYAQWSATAILGPAALSVRGAPVDAHLSGSLDFTDPILLLSALTWVLGGLMFYRLDWLRGVLRRGRLPARWSFDALFDVLMFALVRLAGAVTRFWHHGRLELYLVVVFAMFAIAIYVPVLAFQALPELPALPALTFYEWSVVGLAILGLLTLVLAQTRLVAIVALGVQGLAVALIFLLFGAPDLAFTQLMVEVLSVVILALVMTRLQLLQKDAREFEDLLRDGGLALLCGAGVTILLTIILAGSFDPRLSDFFAKYSATLGHGRNIVNLILVDFRGLDTLGEIAVVMTAGIAILALLRRQKPPVEEAPRPPRRRRTPRSKPDAPAAQEAPAAPESPAAPEPPSAPYLPQAAT